MIITLLLSYDFVKAFATAERNGVFYDNLMELDSIDLAVGNPAPDPLQIAGLIQSCTYPPQTSRLWKS
jgi:hypothetical protein